MSMGQKLLLFLANFFFSRTFIQINNRLINYQIQMYKHWIKGQQDLHLQFDIQILQVIKIIIINIMLGMQMNALQGGGMNQQAAMMQMNALQGGGMNQQAAMMQMNAMMGGGMGMGMGGMGMGMGTSPNMFTFIGSVISLEGRMDNLTDDQITPIQQATINATGTQLKSFSTTGYMCTIIWGSILILPLFCLCMGWWKKCVGAAYSIPVSTYAKLQRIIKAPNINNLSLIVTDNTFNAEKAMILYNLLAESRIKGFTFVNVAGMHNYNDQEYSDFERNMRPIKHLGHIISDIRWGTQIVMA